MLPALKGPQEAIVFLQTLEIRVTFVSTGRQETGQSRHSPSQLLHLFDSSRAPHPNKGGTLIWIGLYASLNQHESQEFSCLDPKHTFRGLTSGCTYPQSQTIPPDPLQTEALSTKESMLGRR